MIVDMYTVGLCAMVAMFALMVGLTVLLIRDQSTLSARQKVLENRTNIELESFRDQVKAMKREKESQQKYEDAMAAASAAPTSTAASTEGGTDR